MTTENEEDTDDGTIICIVTRVFVNIFRLNILCDVPEWFWHVTSVFIGRLQQLVKCRYPGMRAVENAGYNSTYRATTDAGDKHLNVRIYLVNTTEENY